MTAAIKQINAPPLPAKIAAAWVDFLPKERALAEALRTEIFEVAADTPGVGRLTEALRWGQAAYLTEETGAGTTLRLARPKAGGVGLYVHCQSQVIAHVRLVHDEGLTWDGTRGLLLFRLLLLLRLFFAGCEIKK